MRVQLIGAALVLAGSAFLTSACPGYRHYLQHPTTSGEQRKGRYPTASAEILRHGRIFLIHAN